MKNICKICGEEFEAKNKNSRFCNKEHHYRCSFCGNDFILTKNQMATILSGKTPYCSKSCRMHSENPFSRPEIQKKIKETNLKKYGNEDYVKTEEFKNKKKNSLLKKYGVDHQLKSKEVQNKIKSTMKEKYGSEYNFGRQEVKEKLNSEEIKNKRRKTNTERYGKSTARSDEKIQNKIKRTCLRNFGVDNPSKSEEIKIKKEKTYMKHFGKTHFMKSDTKIKEEIKRKSKETCLRRYGVEYACLTENCQNANGYTISKINKIFSETLNKNNIKNTLEFPMKNKSYDIRIECTDILIEINPTHTHNSTYRSLFSWTSETSTVKRLSFK